MLCNLVVFLMNKTRAKCYRHFIKSVINTMLQESMSLFFSIAVRNPCTVRLTYINIIVLMMLQSINFNHPSYIVSAQDTTSFLLAGFACVVRVFRMSYV